MDASLLDRITLDPAVCHGQPTVRGLRYPVANLLDNMGSMTHEEILTDSPDLEEDDLRAVLAYVALVDAQLPRRLAGWNAIHTLDLPMGNRTPDDTLARIADLEGRFVITKDTDFFHSHLLRGKPQRLLLICRRKRFERRLDPALQRLCVGD